MSPITIDNTDETYTVFTVTLNSTYRIQTTVTSAAATVEAWIADVQRVHAARHSNNLHVGLDVEWRPSYGGQQNKVSVIQLCTGDRCLIFQLLHADRIPGALNEFLANPSCRFLGIGIEEDIEKLVCDWDLNCPVSDSKVDLRVLAEAVTGKKEMKQMGVKKLAMEVIGIDVHKSKAVTMSRWDNECLSFEQIKYACVDAFLSFLIGDRLYAGNFKSGKTNSRGRCWPMGVISGGCITCWSSRITPSWHLQGYVPPPRCGTIGWGILPNPFSIRFSLLFQFIGEHFSSSVMCVLPTNPTGYRSNVGPTRR